MTTDCPDRATLQTMKESMFQGTAKDFSRHIQLLTALGLKPGQRLLDYGASWGYGSWQFSRAGFQVVGYEIGRPRAKYAREELGVDVREDWKAVGDGFDAVFCCHVLEHVEKPSAVLAAQLQALRSGGIVVLLTPNGAVESMQKNPGRYHNGWGKIHPYYIDPEFYRTAVNVPMVIASSPLDPNRIATWDRSTSQTHDLSGGELVCVLSKPTAAGSKSP